MCNHVAMITPSPPQLVKAKSQKKCNQRGKKKKGGGEQEKSNTCYKCAAQVRQNPVGESYWLAKVESEGYY